ncbi:MAG: FHA domain-containing protein [Desulfosalsimonadaceae bacterium]
MPIINVYTGNKKIQSYKVRPEEPVSIGRKEDNAIVLNDQAVSGYHAEIENDGSQYFITDYQSRNGTFVNKELVISRQLAHGDRITINPYTLLFAFLQGEASESRETAAMQATMHIDTSDHRARLAKSLSEVAAQEPQRQRTGCLEFLSENRPPVFLSQSVTSIGKSPSSDIVVKGWMVGQTAAEIAADGDRNYVLRFVGGTRKPKVNYQPVPDEVELREFDVIEVGSASMQLHYRSEAGAEEAGQKQQTREIDMEPSGSFADDNGGGD